MLGRPEKLEMLPLKQKKRDLKAETQVHGCCAGLVCVKLNDDARHLLLLLAWLMENARSSSSRHIRPSPCASAHQLWPL